MLVVDLTRAFSAPSMFFVSNLVRDKLVADNIRIECDENILIKRAFHAINERRLLNSTAVIVNYNLPGESYEGRVKAQQL